MDPQVQMADSREVARVERRRAPAEGIDVLVVDDDEDLAAAVSDILTARGHAVRVAHDVGGALVALRRACPQVVVADLNLGAHLGSELLERVMTAAPPPAWQSLERRNIAQLVLRKPFDIGALVDAVESCGGYGATRKSA